MEVGSFYFDVEDIMCDQNIITAELNMDIQNTAENVSVSVTKFRLAASLITQTVIPAIVEVCYACLRNQKIVIASVRYHLLPSVFAFLVNSLSRSLSSIHRGISYTLLSKAEIQQSSSSGDITKEVIENDDLPEKSVCSCVLYEPKGESIKADVIFIHGLHGSLVNTWRQGFWGSEREKVWLGSRSLNDLPIPKKVTLKRTISDILSGIPSKISRKKGEFVDAKNGYVNEKLNGEEDSFSKCWPQDWIPKDCPGARVIAINYTTDPYLWRPVWVKKHNRTSMVERSNEMIEQLLDLQVGKYPIVWVGHSKGGLFIKQILLHCWEQYNNNNTLNLRSLCTSTKAIMFYSVPHRGSYLADITIPLLNRSIELMEIRRNCSFVLDLHRRFLKFLEEISNQPKIFSFVETSLTLMGYLYVRIVQQDSADPGVGTVVGVPLDHREICKPSGRKCFLYRELVEMINSCINN